MNTSSNYYVLVLMYKVAEVADNNSDCDTDTIFISFFKYNHFVVICLTTTRKQENQKREVKFAIAFLLKVFQDVRFKKIT